MVVEELDDFLGISTMHRIVDVPKCCIDCKSGSFPMLIRQVVQAHYCFEQPIAGLADTEARDPCCKSEGVKGRRYVDRLGGKYLLKSSEDAPDDRFHLATEWWGPGDIIQ